MKSLILLLSILIISCNQSEQTPAASNQNLSIRNHAKELIDNDFLKYADSSKVDSLKIQIAKSFNIYDEDNCKISHIDAEALAEFSFDFFLPDLNKILNKRVLQLSAKKLSADEKSFDVLINNDTIQLYTQNNMDDNTFWDKAPRNFFRKVNQLLKSKKCEEQFYLFYTGNDLHTMLLTPEQFLIIRDYYKENEKEKPYIP